MYGRRCKEIRTRNSILTTSINSQEILQIHSDIIDEMASNESSRLTTELIIKLIIAMMKH